MRSIITTIFLLAFALLARSQNILTLEECQQRAEANYPLVEQRELLEKTRDFSIENAIKGYLPRISIGGQATYQSDVTRIPFDMPGVEPLSKDQYRIFGEISQPLYHGGMVRQQKKTEEINAATEAQKLEVELYQLRNRINELFLGILLLQDQQAQSELVKQDLAGAIKKVEASIQHGTALKSAAQVLRAEWLRVDQRIIELASAHASFREILGVFIDQPLSETTVLKKPEWTIGRHDIARPELQLFNYQRQSIDAVRGLLSAGKKPRIELFVQGGYGRPALNMLENSFELYYLGGIRFNWLLSGYYTYRREKEILDLRQRSLDAQQATFLLNTDLTLRQHRAEIEKFRRLIAVDDEIISLRVSVQETAATQLEEGVISATDYISEVNAADQARQNRSLHETQLLMAQARHKFTTGQQTDK